MAHVARDTSFGLRRDQMSICTRPHSDPSPRRLDIAVGASVGRLNGLSACVDYCRDPRTPEPDGDKFGFQMQLGRSALI